MTPVSQSSIQKLVKPPFPINRKYLLVSLVLILIVLWVSLSNKRGPFIELYDYGEHAISIIKIN